MLAGCGQAGGGGTDTSARLVGAPGATAEGGSQAAPLVAAQQVGGDAWFDADAQIPWDAGTRGMWSRVYDWPLVAVHSVLLPDGRVLSYGSAISGQQTGFREYAIWEGTGAPDRGHTVRANGTGVDLFCSSPLLLPGTREVFIGGGDVWNGSRATNAATSATTILSTTPGGSAGDSLARAGDMNRARWYATSTTLLNGEIYIQGGGGGTDYPEVRDRQGGFRLLRGADTSALSFWYPRNYSTADGRVFGYDVDGRMYWIDAFAGTYAPAGQLPGFYVGEGSASVMFRPGRILQFGGNGNGAIVIDLTGGSPSWTPTQSMSSQRQWVSGTLLPDGRVLATGGSRFGNQLIDVNNIAEIWDPATGEWTRGASGAVPRLYHSNALLLPDGSVLVNGGGADTVSTSAPLNNLNAELYYPPYLFTQDGRRAPRPSIVAAPSTIELGRTFELEVAGAAGIARVTLLKTGSATHSFNQEQRFFELPFSATGSRLRVQAPTRGGEATPGWYMIFVIDGAGVPSVAVIASLGVAADPNPRVVPTLEPLAERSDETFVPVELQIVATDPNGDALEYSASGLPAGVALDARTGLISGTPAAPGDFDVTVGVSDGVNAASRTFIWRIVDPRRIVVRAMPQPSPVRAGSEARFSIETAGGTNPRYSWDFGDGSPPTAPTPQRTARHAYSRGGIYVVTVTVTDDDGQVLRRSFAQSVYLPATAGVPSASGPLALETPNTGNPRLWAVNPDADSVTVFDATTLVKIAELAVDREPRALAVMRDGRVWVVNRRSATISIVDPVTLRVVRRLGLPRASQPFGIVSSPTSHHAFLALEGLGLLVKYESDTAGWVGLIASGGTPRHLSISGDGRTLFATRHVSPPLPGESTARVRPTDDSGGEVLAVDTDFTSAPRRIVLRTSNRPDSAKSGRGVPNYLGPAVLSPDGTQAFVPSKQDNVLRGGLRDGLDLTFQNTVRAISSRIDLAREEEDYARRIDHDNASVATAAAFDPYGVYLFVALETSREVAVLDAHSGAEILRIRTGRAPQGLVVSADGSKLFVHNFMDRTVGAYDLRPLLQQGRIDAPLLATLRSQDAEKLDPEVLRGKQLFYDATDLRFARDGYLSCASCHADGGQDGRVWDLTGLGEGLRNTIALRGHTLARQGRYHWTGNFDELQDFEEQIRLMQGGTGPIPAALLAVGTRLQPLGDRKTGLSADLDALSAFVQSLDTFDDSPLRRWDGSLTPAGLAGREVFASRCVECHGGTEFTMSAEGRLYDIGTIKPASGQRLSGALTGIDPPSLRDAWWTAPYLHDGSAATIEDAVRAHVSLKLGRTEIANVADYVRQVGRDERVGSPGLLGEYFANSALSGAPVLRRIEVPDFDRARGAPVVGVVPADGFSVRWSGTVTPAVDGEYRFQTISDDVIRVWIDGRRVIDNWTPHGATPDTSAPLRLIAGQAYSIRIEYGEYGGDAVMRLRWLVPGAQAYVAIPAERLSAN